MKILIEHPPIHILNMILDAGMKPTTTTVYTYGDTIYNPGNINIEENLIEHEFIHSIQQGTKPDVWWQRYVTDPYFRIEQESEAYGHQYNFLCKQFKDRNKRNKILLDLANFLSSPIYGSIISKFDARRMILIKSSTKFKI